MQQCKVPTSTAGYTWISNVQKVTEVVLAHIPDHDNDVVGMIEIVRVTSGISVSFAKAIRNNSVVQPVLSITAQNLEMTKWQC